MSIEKGMNAGELIALAERVEAAPWPDRELDCRVWNAVTMPYLRFEDAAAVVPDYGHWLAPSYTASLEAAMTLVPEGWFTRLAAEDRHSHSWRWDLRGGYGIEAGSRAATPALALTAAALRARAALAEAPYNAWDWK